MWMYPGPSSPDHPSSEELSAVEINTQMRKVLDLGANPNSGAGPVPLQEGVASTRVSISPIFILEHKEKVISGW